MCLTTTCHLTLIASYLRIFEGHLCLALKMFTEFPKLIFYQHFTEYKFIQMKTLQQREL